MSIRDGARATCIAVVVLSSLVAVTTSRSQPFEPDEPLEERALARSYTLKLRVEPKYFAAPGECAEIDLDELKVSLRGKIVQDSSLLRLLHEPQPTLHVLLIGTNGGRLGNTTFAREAARQYIEQLDTEQDRAIIMTFGSSVLMAQSATSDREALLNAIEEVRPSGGVELIEGMYYAIQEVAAHRERPVILTLTNLAEPGRYYDRDDVWRMAARRPDLNMFTIGIDLPAIETGLPPGYSSGRRFLQNIAKKTNGKFFDAPVPSKLEPIYRRIREMLDNEAILFVIDPEPEAEPGKVNVSSRRDGCKIRIFREVEEPEPPPSMQPILRPFGTPPRLMQLEAHHRLQRYYEDNPQQWVDPACLRPWQIANRKEDFGFLEVDRYTIRGCTLDSTQDAGSVFHRQSKYCLGCNTWGRLKIRPFDVRVPAMQQLPSSPELHLDRLAAHAFETADEAIEVDQRRALPAESRPHHDNPMLQNGRIFFEIRPKLARSLFLYREYRDWVLAGLNDRAELDLRALKERYRRMYPDRSEVELAAAVDSSPDAERIRSRASTPSEIDLQGHLAAWLGDVSAHDLFRRWEAMRLNRELSGEPPGAIGFPEYWRALRRTLGLPTYVRVVTLMALVRDPESDTIGYWRIVLPRPGWFMPRAMGDDREEYNDLPMDLIPKVPLGYWVVHHLVDGDPALAALLRSGGYRVDSVAYELLGKSGEHTPIKAFKQTRVTVTLTGDVPEAKLSFAATIEMPAKSRDAPVLRAIDVVHGTDPLLAEHVKGTDLFSRK